MSDWGTRYLYNLRKCTITGKSPGSVALFVDTSLKVEPVLKTFSYSVLEGMLYNYFPMLLLGQKLWRFKVGDWKKVTFSKGWN